MTIDKYGLELTTVPRDLYYHEAAYVRGLEKDNKKLKEALGAITRAKNLKTALVLANTALEEKKNVD